MDIKLNIIPGQGPCNHVTLEWTSQGKRPLVMTMTRDELKQLIEIDSLDELKDLLLGQMRKIIVSNPNASISELKNLLEAETYKI